MLNIRLFKLSLVILLSLFSFACPTWGQESNEDVKIIFTSDVGSSSDIVSISPDGSGARRLTNVLGDFYTRYVEGVGCSPDGIYLVYSIGSRLLRINADGSNVTTIQFGGILSHPAWSPDGTRIAYDGYQTPQGISGYEILVSNSDGTNPTPVTNDDNANWYPAWSPDSQKIAYTYRSETDSGIVLINADGTNKVVLTQEPSNEWYLDWSPDGQRLLFASDRNGNFDIYSMKVDGTDLVQLTSSTAEDLNPKWSPDGRLISFSSDREGDGYQIYTMHTDGTNVQRITPSTFDRSDNYNKCWLVNPVEPPVADAGIDQTLTDSDESGSESVTLDGSASSDSDGSIVSYVWTLDSVEIATGATPTVALAVGVYTITLTVTDDDGATGSDEVVITVSPPAASATLTFQVAAAADDVNEDGSAFTPNDPLIWIGTGASASGSYTGLRFTDVAIPPGATIAAAYVEFHNPQPAWITVGLELAAEAADYSAAFSSSSRPSQRPLTVVRPVRLPLAFY